MRAFCLLICVLWIQGMMIPVSLSAAEGRLRTLMGEHLSGVFRWESNGVVLIDPRQRSVRHVPLEIIERFLVDLPEDPFGSVPKWEPGLDPSNDLPFPWESKVIGAPGDPGRAFWRDGVFRIETRDAELSGVKQSGRLVYESIRGDREMVSRIPSLRYSQDESRAGLCFRTSVDESSPGVFWGRSGTREDVFEWRADSGALMVKNAMDPLPGYRWFKLKRQGDTFSAFRSRDGTRWLLAYRTNVVLARDALVGMAAAAPGTSRSTLASFEQVLHERRMGSSYGIHVELVSGSTLECSELEYDGDALRFFGPQARPRIPLERIARIVFQPIPSRLERRILIGQPGAMLVTGDFIEGNPRSLVEGNLVIDSVLFGRRTFDAVNEVVAAVFHPPHPADAAFRIELRDGSVYRSTQIALEGYSLRVWESALGDCLLPLAELVSIERRLN